MDYETVSLGPITIERIVSRTAALIRESAIQPLVVDTDGAMSLLGCPSKRSFHNEAKDLKLVSYRRVKYRVRDFENALAKAASRAQEKTEDAR